MLDVTRGDDDLLAAILIRMWALASGRPLPRKVRPEQLSEDELIAFWADDLSQAAGRHAASVPGYDVGHLLSQISLEPAADLASGQVRAMLAFDIVGFTRQDRDEEMRIYLHKALCEILWEALEESGLPWNQCLHEDRADGALVVLLPDSAAHAIIDPFPERLRGMIRMHNRMSGTAARLQVRAAAHTGPIDHDDHGLAGDDITLLFRMLHARPLRTALDDSGAELALAISRSMYRSVVRRHPSLAGLPPFRPVNTHVQKARVRGWMYLPGVPSALSVWRHPYRAPVVYAGASNISERNEASVAQKIQTLFVDDLDGSEADGTVRFGLDGTDYEIDLTVEHAEALREALAPYVSAARRPGSRDGARKPARAPRKAPANEPNTTEVREWAKAQGIEVKDRGRVPAELVVKFKAATAT
jgi:Lsr2